MYVIFSNFAFPAFAADKDKNFHISFYSGGAGIFILRKIGRY